MEPMSAFLFSMQAAGLVTSFFGAKSQRDIIEMGKKLENAQFASNMEAIKLQSVQSSLAEIKQVRSNIGSQIAVNAARGNRGGSSVAGITQTNQAFAQDERTRRMNLLAKESELRAGHILSGLHTAQSETQLGQSLFKDIFNSIPVSSLLSGLTQKKSTNNAGVNSGTKEFNYGV
jgi:hypothetical protein